MVRGAGTWLVQRPAGGSVAPQAGLESGPGADAVGAPAGDVEQKAVEGASCQFGVGAARLRTGVGVVVLLAVDPAAHQLLVVIHDHRFTSPTDTRSAPYGRACVER
ncbi:hypothetical protein GCM10017674_67670 [Streptomyces gardneri]|uniref:Uncharacterized protein n=1 Tax=Streptomyces gardneri TaxID=66892 RepID=A0A4Y3RYN6_9ACTN|nr:hypothetical protein SGA01_80500 [Streptomyces gardneri]GHH17014.1 hypothetical protein GCM10017674_67670 [Streptomyces gardneri]